MSNKYKILQVAPNQVPQVVKSDEEDAVIWRSAKKKLREWYLEEARRLRKVREDTYFNR